MNSIINGKIYRVKNFGECDIFSTKNSRFIQNNKSSFIDVLQQEISKKDNFKISNHAKQRLEQRNINLTKEDMNKINEGINKAKNKGAKECLILYKNLALITSIKNRTIITAVDKNSSKENVFTNIDSVVLL
ncbi:hypothetical protein CLTEP_08930 [Clostridium tepidiprofundi DSM 19306]|uniref:Flagellar operon protein n=1 Tax=Clostridium tepidiprofundi DSM 19306 TaxID=1121338 RepID=A0A151B5J5_9CLOT|nr:TIGR02530 family flagellar biosynthesis protein [Clostridium tepidiprofundi]KYH35073.1 hypothetical protein CLTEP_08930 [Clostridium tepidiprofundi DSM 19306]